MSQKRRIILKFELDRQFLIRWEWRNDNECRIGDGYFVGLSHKIGKYNENLHFEDSCFSLRDYNIFVS